MERVFGGVERTRGMRNLYLHGILHHRCLNLQDDIHTHCASLLQRPHYIKCRIIEGAKTKQNKSLTNPARHLPLIAFGLGVIFPCTFPVRPRPLTSTSTFCATPLLDLPLHPDSTFYTPIHLPFVPYTHHPILSYATLSLTVERISIC